MDDTMVAIESGTDGSLVIAPRGVLDNFIPAVADQLAAAGVARHRLRAGSFAETGSGLPPPRQGLHLHHAG